MDPPQTNKKSLDPPLFFQKKILFYVGGNGMERHVFLSHLINPGSTFLYAFQFGIDFK